MHELYIPYLYSLVVEPKIVELIAGHFVKGHQVFRFPRDATIACARLVIIVLLFEKAACLFLPSTTCMPLP